MLKREDIIALVAKEHGILISRDDPILALLAVHQVLVEHYARQLGQSFEGMSQQLSEQLGDIQNRYGEQSRQLANEVVGGAVERIAEAEKRLVAALQNRKIDHREEQQRLARMEWGLWLLVVLAVVLLFVQIMW